jgi:predicted transcriptional regulator
MITNRDIAIEAVVRDCIPPSTKVRDIVTTDAKYCFDDEKADHVTASMGEQQICRLPVVDRCKCLVGIISLSDPATAHDPVQTGQVVDGIVRTSDKAIPFRASPGCFDKICSSRIIDRTLPHTLWMPCSTYQR